MEHAEEILQAGDGTPVMEPHEPHSGMRSVQNLEAVINEGLRAALLEETPDQALEVLLEHLGKALNGERTYIFEQNESGGDDNTYEWVAGGVEPERENLQNVPPEVCAGWYRNFSVGGHIVIQNVEDIRETEPLQYENLKRQGIRSLVVVPLYDKKRLIGFYGVDNPPVKSLEYATNILQTAAYFIVSSLKRRDLFRELQKRSYLEGRQSLEGILEGARTGIWTIELEENCPPRMYADRTMRILLGVPDNIGPEACYRHWFERIEPDYVGMVEEAVREILEAGRSEVIYSWNHPKLGRIYVRCGGVPDRTFQKPGVCLSGYHQDITETMAVRKKQEQSIMELLERVKRANSAKSEFLSHMSHDLRTPINGILGMLAILEKSQDDPDRQKECRRKLRVSAEHLLSLVNDVLQISKLESGRAAAVEEPFDLCAVLDDCVTVLSPLAEERAVRLELETSGLRHSRVIGNPLHVKQILMSVIDNALKYNRPNGSVFVRAEETAFREGTASCRFVIEDTGIGIGEDFKQHIFEPFTQEHQDARTDYNGAGLGMSIVKKLVDQMGGTVEISSRAGQGSVVRITLPIRVNQARETRPEKEERGDIAGMRVLLAEDNEINCEIVEFMLRDGGAEVVTAGNGKAAVDAFEASAPGTFDCILMDLMMPVMSGYEAARVIRGLSRADAKTVPIIALSANAFEEDVALAKDAGMNEHLAKPVDVHRMFQAMSRLKER
ncbi:MAG: response regulator [Oscillibacter sp.]|nr:response regulator [Oscillibacter sp.]